MKAQQSEVNEFFTGYSVSNNEELDEELAKMEEEMYQMGSLPSEIYTG